MNLSSTSERMAEAMQRARSHWRRQLVRETREMQPLPQPPAHFTVAISREAGTNAAELAQLLAERWRWPYYDHDLVEYIAQESRVRHELVESLDEKPISLFRECAEAFFNIQKISAGQYLHRLVETLTSLAAHGECVIVGRGDRKSVV